MAKKKVVRKATWKITVENFEDGTSRMVRQNDGFSACELLGIVELVRQELLKILEGDRTFRPDVIERKFVYRGKKK